MLFDDSFDERCAEAWEESRDYVVDPSDESRMLTQILGQIRSEDHHHIRTSHRTIVLVAAASLAFVLLLGSSIWGWTRFYELDNLCEEVSICADKGQKSRVTLPDGTIVNLNSDSQIRYMSNFNRRNREVTLSGEAYFEVAKNPELPFVVKAGEVSVKALGTKFNVSAYPEDGFVTTTLTEGKVLAAAGDGSCMLLPGDEVVWNRSDSHFVKGKVASQAHMVPWIEGQLYLDNESFCQLARTLSRMYNVEIIYDENEVRKLCFTGLLRNSSLPSVLDLICATSTLKYRMENNIIYFSNK